MAAQFGINATTDLLLANLNSFVSQITRKLCEEELVKVKGVISFTFIMNKSRCLVRCKLELSPETLCDAINNTKILSAQQVVKNERGEEVRVHNYKLKGEHEQYLWNVTYQWGRPIRCEMNDSSNDHLSFQSDIGCITIIVKLRQHLILTLLIMLIQSKFFHA